MAASPPRSDALSDGDGRDRRVPAALATALAAESPRCATCSQCGHSVLREWFVPYSFDFSFERDPALRPDPEAVAAFGQGECWDCWKSAPDAGVSGKCVRCGRGWGGYSHYPNCKGRVR
jgi:hypothetical protein